MSTFYEFYLKLCNERGVSPSRAALDIGISKTSVTRWKQGYCPTDANLKKMSSYFDVPIEYLKEKCLSDFYNSFIRLCAERKVAASLVAEKIGLSRASAAGWKKGAVPSDVNLQKIADYFGVSVEYLKGDGGENKKISPPNITEDYTTFAVIGEVAAGYDSIAVEDWEGETIDIPNAYLRGRSKDEYFVLKVKGDSMYPAYQDGDKVLVLKQSTLNYSGQVGVILYDDDYASLKKVEYMQGEDWLRMVPINPAHPIKKVVGEQLEHCRILGIPKLLIREIED